MSSFHLSLHVIILLLHLKICDTCSWEIQHHQQYINIYIKDTMYVYIQWLVPTKFDQSINQQSWNQVKEYYTHIVPCMVLHHQHWAWLPHDVVEWNLFSRFTPHFIHLSPCKSIWFLNYWIVHCRLWYFTEGVSKENIKVINRTIYV